MRIREILAGVAALGLVAAPIALAAAPVARTGAPVDGEQFGDAGFAWGIGVILVAVLGILVLTDDDEEPVSP